MNRFIRLTVRPLSIAAAFTLLLVPVVVHAAQQNFDVGTAKIQQGMLVALSANPGIVESATDKDAASLIGVVAAPNEQNFDHKPGQVSVATDSLTPALVSTLNGDIAVGDHITVSSIVGVGAKAVKNSWVVGVAQASLNAKSSDAVKSTITDSKGGKHAVAVASIPVLVHVSYYATGSAAVPKETTTRDSLQKAADRVAGKHVSVLIVVLSFVLIFAGVALAGVIASTAIRNGFTAIARQPLAKKLIFRRVMQSFALAMAILAGGLAGALALLKIV